MNKGLIFAIIFVIVAVALKIGLRTSGPDGVIPKTIDGEVADTVSDMETLQTEHMQAESWDDVDSANEKLKSFNDRARADAAAFLKLPHIANATGELASYRDMFREEFAVLEVTEPRRLEIEAQAREFEKMDIATYATENPQEYLAQVGEFCQNIKEQKAGTLEHLEFGKSRKAMLEDPDFFQQVFLDQLTYEAGMEAMEKIVANRSVVYQSWEQTWKNSECETVLSLSGK